MADRLCDSPCTMNCRIDDIYQAVMQIAGDLGDMKGDLGEAKATLKSVEAEAKRTNSRVTHAEEEITSLKVWRGTTLGGAAVISVVGSAVVVWLKQRLGL